MDSHLNSACYTFVVLQMWGGDTPHTSPAPIPIDGAWPQFMAWFLMNKDEEHVFGKAHVGISLTDGNKTYLTYILEIL